MNEIHRLPERQRGAEMNEIHRLPERQRGAEMNEIHRLPERSQRELRPLFHLRFLRKLGQRGAEMKRQLHRLIL